MRLSTPIVLLLPLVGCGLDWEVTQTALEQIEAPASIAAHEALVVTVHFSMPDSCYRVYDVVASRRGSLVDVRVWIESPTNAAYGCRQLVVSVRRTLVIGPTFQDSIVVRGPAAADSVVRAVVMVR